MRSEEPKWIEKVQRSLLTIREQQIKELKRFCGKFGITQIRIFDGGELLSYEQVMDEAIREQRRYFYTNAGYLEIKPISNKPFLAIALHIQIIDEREIQVHNGEPKGQPCDGELSDEFSDESWEIAKALAEVWKGQIKTLREQRKDGYTDLLVVVLPDSDYFEVAYNPHYHNNC